jgi:hypothetical protein
MALYNTYGIYRISCLGNEMFYIGSTIRSFGDRFKKHRFNLKNSQSTNLKLQTSYNSYGLNSFVFEILFDMTGEAKELVRNKEQEYIDMFICDPLCCNDNNFCGNWVDKENRKFNLNGKDLSYSHESRKVYNELGEEFPSIQSAAIFYNRCKSGLHQHLHGKTKSFAGLYWGFVGQEIIIREKEDNSLWKKKKVRSSDGQVFESIAQAAQKTNVHPTNIGRVINGTQNTAGGLQWFLVEE